MNPFSGLRILDLSPNRVGAQVSQCFADFGADVIQVEPPGGASMRSHAAFAFWARGKRSIVLDVFDDADRDTIAALMRRADVVIDTFRPGVLEARGLAHATIAANNPGLISTSISGFGRQGPWADLPGYEGIVNAKLGVFHTFRRMSNHPSPPFVTAPFAAFAASQTALHGTLAALVERSRSGHGQQVDTSLVQGYLTLDTWAWFQYLVAARWPDAYPASDSYDNEGRPASPLTFMLLVALTGDGAWLQFAAVAPHLFAAKMKALGLAWMFTDEKWKGLPLYADPEKRLALWTKMLEAAKDKTLADWQNIFDHDHNVFAEQFRGGSAILEHPQLVHDAMVVDIDDAVNGRVRQPGPIVKAAATPPSALRSAPRLDEHHADILAEILSAATAATAAAAAAAAPAASTADTTSVAPAATTTTDLPLAGVTILELATLFAAPHGTTMLTDMGAKVYKVEPLAGDRIRTIIPFPESGGAKVMQGKESICVDLTTPEGLAIVRELASKVDVVVQGYRAGSMSRLGLDYASIKGSNPAVIYVNAPGYGVDGPYGAKPAYAPSIGAAAGLPLTNVGSTVGTHADLTMAEIQDAARRISAAGTSTNAQADGFAALGVATAILFGLVARERGAGGQELFSSMLNTGAHAMSAQAVTFPGAPAEPAPDAELRGLGPLYRIYDAAPGYVFLAAPTERAWTRLVEALAAEIDLAGDARFASAAARTANADALTEALTKVFARRSAEEWERDLLARGVAAAAVATVSTEEILADDAVGRAGGYVADAVHPTFDAYQRVAPYVRFSRSATVAPAGVLAGQHTDAVLAGLGRTAEEIAALRAANIVA